MKQAIVYIITTLELGGAQKVCLELFHGCHKESRPTFLITGGQGPLLASVAGNERVIILPSLIRAVGIKTIFYEIITFFQIIKTIKHLKKSYDELIVHTHSSKAGIVGRWAAWCAGIKTTVHTVHGFAFHEHQPKPINFIYQTAEKLTSLVTNAFVCVSEHDIEAGQKIINRFKDRTYCIRAAVAEPKNPIIRHRKTETPFIIGTVSCFKPQKNILDLLQSFAHAYQYNKNLRLELIGDGIERPLIEAFIEGRNLHDVVILHGWQSHIFEHLARWDVFALTSLWEGLPCAIIEARHAQLPVLSYRTGGIPEVIKDGHNGFLYPQKAWRQLAEGIIRLASDSILYKQLAEAPNDLSAFSIPTMLQQHEQMYSGK